MITYHIEHKNFKLLKRRLLSTWLKQVIVSHSKIVGDINFIFCDDPYILDINKTYLDHHYYTDVITFDTSEYVNHSKSVISGDIFVSVDTIRDNAKEYGVSFEDEFLRVTVHGILHLLGYDDLSDVDKIEMRENESKYIELYKDNAKRI